MCSKNIFLIFLICFLCNNGKLLAQNKYGYFKDGTKPKRDEFYKKVITGIEKTIALPLNETTEDRWISAFYNIALVQYKNSKVNIRLDYAAKNILAQSIECKMAFLNLVNSEYPTKYIAIVKSILEQTTDAKLVAMAANYIMANVLSSEGKFVNKKYEALLKQDERNDILIECGKQLANWNKRITVPDLKPFFDKNYLPNTTIVFSFQRRDRNYPGLVLIRQADGNFYKNENGKYFTIGQLARSLSNMPGYISNGNTPQGFFKINGFDTSSNYFIGNTTNIQLSMPHEYHRLDSNNNIMDTTWTLEQYKNLLPKSFQNYQPLYSSFYAGKIGRTEIIIHGTTVDTSYYKGKTYFPYTPTMGCLTSVETWSSTTGQLQTSNQLLLTQALQKAGGANGYFVVIEIDDKKAAVSLGDLERWMR
jgi:hypothetical protein